MCKRYLAPSYHFAMAIASIPESATIASIPESAIKKMQDAAVR